MNFWAGGEPTWEERYEALRTQALGHAPLGHAPLGLGVLRHRGVVAWMAAEVSGRAGMGMVPLQAVEPSGGLYPLGEVHSSSSSRTKELIRLLAGTALLAGEGGHA